MDIYMRRLAAVIGLLTVSLLTGGATGQPISDSFCDRVITCAGSIPWGGGTYCNLTAPTYLVCRPSAWWTCTPGAGAAVTCTGMTTGIPAVVCTVPRANCL